MGGMEGYIGDYLVILANSGPSYSDLYSFGRSLALIERGEVGGEVQ